MALVEQKDQLEGIRRLIHRRLQGGKSCRKISANADLFMMLNRVLDLGILDSFVVGHVVGHFVYGDGVSVVEMDDETFVWKRREFIRRGWRRWGNTGD